MKEAVGFVELNKDKCYEAATRRAAARSSVASSAHCSEVMQPIWNSPRAQNGLVRRLGAGLHRPIHIFNPSEAALERGLRSREIQHQTFAKRGDCEVHGGYAFESQAGPLGFCQTSLPWQFHIEAISFKCDGDAGRGMVTMNSVQSL
jgi:hypothetical protein